MLNRTKELEVENERADPQRRWDAYHAGEPTDLQALVDSTRHLEGVLGARPGALLNDFRKGKD
jgi:hypothetical protein